MDCIEISLMYQKGEYIKVTCETDTLTQYFVVHNGDSVIHMATYITEGSFCKLVDMCADCLF